MCSAGALSVLPFEHPPLDLLFGFDGRQVCQREEVVALVVSAFIHELLATLIVDHPRHGVRKSALIRIARCAGTDEVRVEHPAAAQPENRIEPHCESVHLRVGGGMHVGTSIRPAGKQRAVLLEKYAVLDESEWQQQISQSPSSRSMLCNLHSGVTSSSRASRCSDREARSSPDNTRCSGCGGGRRDAAEGRPCPFAARPPSSRSTTPPPGRSPTSEARLNASPPAIMTITSTSSRSPPSRRLGRFADW